jgi:hypothetical protein
MPYKIVQHGDKFSVVAQNTGHVAGTHPSKQKAQAQMAALYANEPEASVKKCMTCGCDDLGNDHHYISDTEKCISCIEKGQGPCWEGYEYAGTKEQNGRTVPNCIPVKKADGGYQPNAGMKAAARRALRWRDAGMATGAGTPVGWGRASDIVAGRSMSLETVKRMYSFFSRHEVDKKGKDWNKPSHGKIMWNAWGGDAGFAWSRAIVARENKIEKESVGAGRIDGGVGFKLEYNVPDCQGGYAITKAGTGQVIGCYTTKEHAQEAMDAIAVNEPDLTKAVNPTPTKDSTSIWDGVFEPLGDIISGTNYGDQMGDVGWKSTYNAPPDKDGGPSVGYGNRSDKHGRSNS